MPILSKEFGVFEQFNVPIGAICGDANASMMGEKMLNVGDIKVSIVYIVKTQYRLYSIVYTVWTYHLQIFFSFKLEL